MKRAGEEDTTGISNGALVSMLAGLLLVIVSACTREDPPHDTMADPVQNIDKDAGSEPPPRAADAGKLMEADAAPPKQPQQQPPAAEPTHLVQMSPAAAPLPAALPPEPVNEWRSIGYDYASTYFNRAETKLTKDNVSQLKVAWQVNLGSNIYSAPLQVADRIYISGPNDVRAFDADSGKELWKLAETSSSTLSFAEDVLYLNTHQSEVIAIDATTGTTLWRRRSDAQKRDGLSSVVAVEDRVLLGASNDIAELSGDRFRGFVSALDRTSGDVLWTSYTVPETAYGAGIFSSPSVDLGARRVFVTTANNFGPPATDTSDAFIALDLDTEGSTLTVLTLP